MGSFCCEQFGVDRFRTLTRKKLTNALKNSDDSPHSDPAHLLARNRLIVAALSAALVTAAVWWLYTQGLSALLRRRAIPPEHQPQHYRLHALPATTRLAVSGFRSSISSACRLSGTTLGGALALPAPFLLLFASCSRPCFFTWPPGKRIATCLLAAITAACFALNPNLLYLGSIPMTEVVFFAAFSILLFSLFRFRRTQNRWLIILGGAASIMASLTRYDGWFFIPFFAVGFFWFARERRVQAGVLFSCIASLAPLYWLAHNCWETSDSLDLLPGPYSAKAIYQRALDAGLAPIRGDHNWG